jgi:hypothetical protein
MTSASMPIRTDRKYAAVVSTVVYVLCIAVAALLCWIIRHLWPHAIPTSFHTLWGSGTVLSVLSSLNEWLVWVLILFGIVTVLHRNWPERLHTHLSKPAMIVNGLWNGMINGPLEEILYRGLLVQLYLALLPNTHWSTKLAAFAASIPFRNVYDYFGRIVGWILSWIFGMIMFWTTFKHGLAAAMVVHAVCATSMSLVDAAFSKRTQATPWWRI